MFIAKELLKNTVQLQLSTCLPILRGSQRHPPVEGLVRVEGGEPALAAEQEPLLAEGGGHPCHACGWSECRLAEKADCLTCHFPLTFSLPPHGSLLTFYT